MFNFYFILNNEHIKTTITIKKKEKKRNLT